MTQKSYAIEFAATGRFYLYAKTEEEARELGRELLTKEYEGAMVSVLDCFESDLGDEG